MLGDFNRHHPDWDESHNAHLFTMVALDLVQPLLDLISNTSLEMALPRDLPTPTVHILQELHATQQSPSSRPPCTDHFPIISALNLATTEAPNFSKPNFKRTDWPLFRHQEEIDSRADDLVKAINDAVQVSTPTLKLCAWSKKWWSPELEAHRKLSRSLAARSYQARSNQADPVHEEYRVQQNRYSQAIKDAKRAHWETFLEELDKESMWTAARYLQSEPTDSGCTRVPNLKHTHPDGSCTTASDNNTKSRMLMASFFPPAPQAHAAATSPNYPAPVDDLLEIQTIDIRQAVLVMKPFKAPGPDGLPACVYIHAIDLLDMHLLPIFRASLRLGIYPTAWCKSRTVMLCKPGKPDYGLAKAYRPIALLNVISKILSSCIADHLNHLAEGHGWLPDHHFGGRPGRTTTDALHLIVKTIKDAWAAKKVASALYLDVKGAFPHAYPLRLAENMRNLGVPMTYVNWMLAKLSGRTTCLAFDNYTSTPLPIENSIDQGCPLLVIFYLLYNAPLVKVPCQSSDELCVAYIDDITFITWGPTFEDNHRSLVDMMSRRGGALEWSNTHNSTFELDKTACMDFAPPAMSKKLALPPLHIRGQVITPVKSHTLLGVIMDQMLNWREQCDKALAKGQKWAGQLNRLARMSFGTSVETARRLYLSIAVPRFTYVADVWFTPVTQGPSGRRSGSAGFADRLARIQSTAARVILGAMSSTPVTAMDAHLDLLPMHILMNETCQRAAIRLAATPTDHPLHKAVIKCTFAGVKPTDFEQWPFGKKPLPSIPPEAFQDRHEAAASAWADKSHLLVFSDASVSRAGVAVAAVLWSDGGRELRAGIKLDEHNHISSLDAEVAGVLLAVHLVSLVQDDTVVDDATIYSDSQAAILCINHHAEGASRDLLRATRKALRKARKGSGGTTIQLKWCPGHMGVPGNEEADAEAHRVASGHVHPQHLIPQYLVNFRPATNPTTRKQIMKTDNKSLAEAHWASSSAGAKHAEKYPNLAPRHFLAHTRELPRSRTTLLFRLITGHVQLRSHLYRLQLADSPQCEHCRREPETVTHFLFRCPRFAEQRHTHLGSQGADYLRLPFVLHATSALAPLFDFIKGTGRFADLVR
ncbi:hypothetical protein OPQ81_011131 [Rhizoctonia solani]|nr:hypothetical protein OPQ81_011131 [Rhizoctonia solani]